VEIAMVYLIAGVIFWSVVHLFPSVAPAARANLGKKLGENGFKGLFTLDSIIALALIVYGWRTADVTAWYVPPLLGSPIVTLLVLLAFFLFAAANAPGNTRRFLRHPMLTGVIVWGLAHLLANGENRSVVLFGGFALWALISIVTISRRDGPWKKPAAVSPVKDIMTLIASAVVFAIVLFGHQWAFGVSPIPG
jgi:uncharacterized membrane protein